MKSGKSNSKNKLKIKTMPYPKVPQSIRNSFPWKNRKLLTFKLKTILSPKILFLIKIPILYFKMARQLVFMKTK